MVSWLPWMEEHAGSSPVILTVHTAQINITVIVSSTLTTRTILYAPMAESIRTGLRNHRPYSD